jgi:hypothetical protein
MAQLVEIALEEECTIKSERFKRNYSDKGYFVKREVKMRSRSNTNQLKFE